MLATCSFAVFMNAFCLAVPGFLLFLGALVRNTDYRTGACNIVELVSTPLYSVFPAQHSHFGLAKHQHKANHFFARTILLRLLCCSIFWVCFWTQLGGAVSTLANNTCPMLLSNFQETTTTTTQSTTFRWGGMSDSDENHHVWTDADCSIMPGYLQEGCHAGAFRAGNYDACIAQRTLFFSNLCSAEASVCVMLLHEALREHSINSGGFYNVMMRFSRQTVALYDGWKVCIHVLLYFPTVFFMLWLVVSVAVPLRQGHLQSPGNALYMFGSAAKNRILQDVVQAKAKEIQHSIQQGTLEPSFKDKLQLFFDFALLVLDFVTDINCFIQALQSVQYEVAAIQAVAILLPILVDLYRSGGQNFQLIEAACGFAESWQRGFATNRYIRAFQTEKGIEAPLSFMLQYYTVFRVTSFIGFFSIFFSMPLSIYGISKYVFTNFQLGIYDVLQADPTSLEPTDGVLPIHSAVTVGNQLVKDTE